MQEESSGGAKPYTVRGIALMFNRPVSTERKIFRNILDCYSYTISHLQDLFPSEPARETFALQFFARMEVEKEQQQKMLWTDEAYLNLTGFVNTQNFRIWAAENLLETKSVPHHHARVSVW